jgi:hypothetical protein
MSLWQYFVAIGLIVGAAYTYVFQPMALELGVPKVQCWWKDGVYLRSTEKERGYTTMMHSTPANLERLKRGEAQGCFPEGTCVAGPVEAKSVLETKMLSWTAVGGGQLLAGNVLSMLGNENAGTAKAKQVEAEYCLTYLGDVRRSLEP